jgi:ribosomal protein S18 acetylase RimI-like enzyme
LNDLSIRDAASAEVGPLAKIWYDGWQDAHARILPEELARLRTMKSFEERLERCLASMRVAGPAGTPLGFCVIRGDELYQLYVSSKARGSGLAAALLVDAETRLRDSGVRVAWLGCAIGNERAARFYEKCGWRRSGVVTEQLEVPNGTYPLEVWRYEKLLAKSARD